MKNKPTTKWTINILLMMSVALTLQFCASPQKPMPPAEPAKVIKAANAGVTYSNDIKPIMENSCTPCHYPERGKKTLLNTYAAATKHIDEIMYRIQLPADSSEFMPYKSKKAPLTEVEIKTFKLWLDQGAPE